MSRALDKSVKEALKHGDHQRVFLDISDVLTEPSDQLLEIELLGKSHILDPSSTVLRDENAVAIPKLRIVQAFIVAHKLHEQFVADNGNVLRNDILRSTAVMLLMDPEHLTAANTRKRLVMTKLKDKDVLDILRSEKHLLDSLLTSRLHRHTKSPTLWNHRRWLMEQYRLQGIEVPVEDDISKIIMVSGERHPRNYYAWCHARYLINAFILPSLKAGEAEALSRMIGSTQKWCFAHHNDISGWQFLIFLLDKRPSEISAAFRETLKFACSFKWRNESVWYFLRYIVAWGVSTADMEEFGNVRRALLDTASEDESGKRTLERATQWLEVTRGIAAK
ncbi:hypothetical protein NW768_008808 [Fusarium equiseti]|uniref:Protein prenyltransferase n=1 Tax=Fusarium equiseti TaxID=61235 RepID=A0ABQ8R525_FUSEQ|nr:hypothetical protein NW768_008808 [Fusarium equiseti]